VSDLRIGKAMKMELMAENEDSARAVAEEACRKVLVNQVMEFYEIKIKTLEKIT
jgi:phosphoribosylformylglycinamidine synthase